MARNSRRQEPCAEWGMGKKGTSHIIDAEIFGFGASIRVNNVFCPFFPLEIPKMESFRGLPLSLA
jgi:hypothetical protein